MQLKTNSQEIRPLHSTLLQMLRPEKVFEFYVKKVPEFLLHMTPCKTNKRTKMKQCNSQGKQEEESEPSGSEAMRYKQAKTWRRRRHESLRPSHQSLKNKMI